jgi:2-oxoisovalerate ferredoxin oxidoreductase beta subunit
VKKGVLTKPDSLYDVFTRKPGVDPEATHYCPGCGHGNLHKLIAEALDDLGVRERTIFISPVGCSVFGYYYFRCGNIQAPHGRAAAVATAVKRARPDSIVISYQGDGDLAAIGANNSLQAANRGEQITVFFVNNAIYGMTGGQMAPTSLIDQHTSTSPYGRSVANEGYPLRICELFSSLDAPVYLERCALDDTKHILKARAAIRKALKYQIERKGYSLVEFLSPCPTGWKIEPVESRKWVTEAMTKVFPIAVYKERRDATAIELPRPLPLGKDELRLALDIPEDDDLAPETGHTRGTFEFVVAGFGGQGVLFLGQLLAKTGMAQGRRVTWLPSYGPEMRGGTANCSVVLSDERIGSPLVPQPNILLAFNQPSVEKFGPKVRKGGVVMYDDSFMAEPWDRTDVTVYRVPFTNIANQLGSSKVMNMVALGAVNGVFNLFSDRLVEHEIRGLGKERFVEINMKAYAAGKAAVTAKAAPAAVHRA